MKHVFLFLFIVSLTVFSCKENSINYPLEERNFFKSFSLIELKLEKPSTEDEFPNVELIFEDSLYVELKLNPNSSNSFPVLFEKRDSSYFIYKRWTDEFCSEAISIIKCNSGMIDQITGCCDSSTFFFRPTSFAKLDIVNRNYYYFILDSRNYLSTENPFNKIVNLLIELDIVRSIEINWNLCENNSSFYCIEAFEINEENNNKNLISSIELSSNSFDLFWMYFYQKDRFINYILFK